MLTYLIVFKTVVTDLHLVVSAQYILNISENNSGKSNSVVIHIQYQCSVSFYFFSPQEEKYNDVFYVAFQLVFAFFLFPSLPSTPLPLYILL